MAESIKKDLVIIGGGPAGLSAAIYAQRALLDNVVLEQEAVGGQIILTSEVDNYPGVPHTDGFSLVDAMQNQVKDLGGDIRLESVNGISKRDDGFVVGNVREHVLGKDCHRVRRRDA
jgi:thioredoxin reductase (NADPH)